MAAWGAANRRVLDRWLGPLVSLALVLPLAGTVAWVSWREECWDVPTEIQALADDPQAAVDYLVPGADSASGSGDASGVDSRVAALLSPEHWTTCQGPAGPDLLGSILLAATTGQTAAERSGPAVPHTLPMSVVVHETVMVLGAERPRAANLLPWRDPGPQVPPGLEPYLATMLAAYVRDVNDGAGDFYAPQELPDEAGPALTHPDTGEWRPVFRYDNDSRRPLQRLLGRITVDPVAYATLHDAFRAHYADYLDRLTVDGDGVLRDPEDRAPALTSYNRFRELTYGTTALAQLRALHVRDGRIEDVDAFDETVLESSRGVFRTGARAGTGADTPEPPLTGDVARRAPDSSVAETGILDGRQHLLGVLAHWAEEHGLSESDLLALNAALEEGYFNAVHAARSDYAYF
ncbi:hypothetical protein ACFVUW_17810 [Streptomyces xiamenensis]|uniref:hypothetical protein n=1 Tax=Streptomyces xiamenensis TaxID=408015 RepID=UPI0036EEA1D7